MQWELDFLVFVRTHFHPVTLFIPELVRSAGWRGVRGAPEGEGLYPTRETFSTQERKETATLEHAHDTELFCSCPERGTLESR